MLRVYRFLKTNLFFAVLPLVIVSGIRYLANAPTPFSSYAPEILFLSVAVSIAAIDDINEDAQQFKVLLFDIIRTALQVFVYISIGLYCVVTYSTIRNPEDIDFRNTVTVVAASLSVVLCLTSIAAEVLLARSKGATP